MSIISKRILWKSVDEFQWCIGAIFHSDAKKFSQNTYSLENTFHNENPGDRDCNSTDVIARSFG